MKKLFVLMIFLVSLSLQGGTLMSIGPSLGVLNSENGTGFSGTLDLTFAYTSMKKWPFKEKSSGTNFSVFWLSLGTRGHYVNQWTISPYIECGLWLLANIGVGYSYQIEASMGNHIVHLFIGIPIPINFTDILGTPFYFEPYYRPGWIVNNGGTMVHDVGLLMKFIVNFDKV